jgi:hypothetical protein
MARKSAKKGSGSDVMEGGVGEALSKGIAAVEKGDRGGGHEIFRQTAELHPNTADVWVWLGGTSASLDDAQAAFERARSLDPDNEVAALGLRWVQVRRAGAAPSIVGAPVPAPTTVEPAGPTTWEMPASIQCPNCAAENVPTEKFCRECGQDLRATIAMLAPNRDPLAGIKPVQPRMALSSRAIILVVIIAVLVAGALAFWYFTGVH